jgi:HK97 family phage portal protein
MANWLTRLIGSKQKAVPAEGEYRPGPYLLDGGWLSASAGKLLNWWQTGVALQNGGEGGAMVEACVSAYAQTAAMCPGGHWRSTGDGGRVLVENSDLARILKRPNDYESMSDFLLNLTDRLYRDGEAFAYAVRDGAKIVELHRMRHGYPYIGDDGSIFYSLSGNDVAERRFDLSFPVPARDVLHVRLRTPRHPLRGVSPILAVALDQALSSAALNQQIAFYLNEAKPSFMLETEQQLTAEQTKALRSRWDEQTKGDNAGGTPILTWGLKAHQVGSTAKDSMLADMLKLSDQNIALAFRMPLQILGIGGTPFASTEALMSAWKSTGLGFCLNHIEEAFGRLFRLDGMPDEYLELDTDALLRSSFKEMIDGLVAGTDKIMTKNEARRRIGLARKEGGDDLFRQMQDIGIGAPVDQPASVDEALPVEAGAADVQATALNGAQVTALQEMLLAAANGALPKATVSAAIAAAFPLISAAQVAQMLDAIVPDESAPPAEDDPQKLLEAVVTAMHAAIEPVIDRVDDIETAQREAIAAIPDQVRQALPPPPDDDFTDDLVAAINKGWETAK